MNQALTIRPMRPSDITTVSKLHLRMLPGVIAKIGIPYLAALYTHLLRKKHLHITLIAQFRSRTIGVITATKNLYGTQHATQYIIMQPAILASVCMALVTGRVTISELVARLQKERHFRLRFQEPYPTILTFFVDTSFQNKGIGTKLLKTLCDDLPRHTRLYVDTEHANIQAQRWYKSHGFEKIGDIDANIIYRQRFSR